MNTGFIVSDKIDLKAKVTNRIKIISSVRQYFQVSIIIRVQRCDRIYNVTAS